MSAYHDFASLYDALMNDVDYDAWFAHYRRLLDVDAKSKIAELGCGTGEMTIRFAKTGYSILGTDLSPDMIAVAQEKARRAGAQAAFAVQDMVRFALPRRVHAIFCGCDGINYLTSIKQVQACFARVYENLRPGGRFAFDISAPHKLQGMAGQMYGEDRDDVTYLWMNEYQEETRLLRMSLVFFVRGDNGLYRRFEEEHVQRAHTVPEMEQALKCAGFEQVRAYSGFTLEDAKPDDDRVHFAAQKPVV